MKIANKWIQCIGKYKIDTILTPVFVTLEVIFEIIIPLLMAHMIDKGITSGNMDVIVKTGLWLSLLCILSLLSGALAGRFAARASTGFAKNLRRSIFYKIQEFSFTIIDRFSQAGLVTRMTTDVSNVQNAFQMIIRIFFRAPLMLIFSVVMVFSVNVKLAWVFAGIIPVLGIGLTIIILNAHPLFMKVFSLYDKLNLVVQENLHGIRVVKSYVREEHETKKFKKSSDEIYQTFVKAEKIIVFNSPLMQFCIYVCTLLICWLGAQMIVQGTFTTGQLLSLLSYTMMILMSLMVLSMIFVMLTMSRASIKRISEVLYATNDMENKKNPVTQVKDGSVRFKNVDFGYHGKDGKLCLSNINIEIAPGQTVGIIGGTGSGKSTLTQLIPRLYDATGGSVEIGGINVKDYDIEALRGDVAMVLQNNILFSGSIKDNLRWGNKDATDEEMERVCRLSAADEFIRAFPNGYETWIDQGGANVSGGQKQRLCIARALLKKPKILILDDSTSAVDTKTDSLIRGAFRDEIPDTTKIIIAQRISSVQEADKIIVMDDGRIAAIGAHEELLKTSAIYREVYESQQKGGLQDAA
jgi:ATP-binding cassette subfamily B protein